MPHLPFPHSSPRASCARFAATTVDGSTESSTGARIALLIVLHVFAKRSAKIPEREIRVAQERWDDFKARMKAERRVPDDEAAEPDWNERRWSSGCTRMCWTVCR